MVETIKINDNTWRIEDGDVRFLLLYGAEKAALIDTGMNTPDARQIAEGLTELPLILINTHADPDHISGNEAFEEFYMSPAEEDNYRGHDGKGKMIPVKEGDIIYAKRGMSEIIGRGIVTGKYYYDEEFDKNHKHMLKVNWKTKGNWKYDGQLPMKTLTNIGMISFIYLG